MSTLTTHVLDTTGGIPASSMTIRLFSLDVGEKTKLLETVTNSDGRTGTPLLEGESMREGVYELEFEVGNYFGKSAENKTQFLDCVVIRFGISDPASHYHVPLLVSPYSYSTYRGS